MARRFWAPLTAAGSVLCIAGCGLVPLVTYLRNEGVRSALVVDSYDAWADKHTGIDHPYDVKIWNVTNLLEVLEAGAKPRFDEVSFRLTYVEECYDLEWVDDRASYTYGSWWNYYPADDGEAARLNASEFVQINPVYLGAIADFGGSEAALFTGLGYVVLANVVALLEGFVDGVRYYSVPTYLANVRDTLLSGYAAYFPDAAAVAAQWGAFAVVGASLSTLDASLTTFDVGAVGNGTYVALWDEATPYSLLTAAGYEVWLGALGGDADAYGAVAAAFGTGDAAAVLAWLGALIDESNPYYLGAVAAALPAGTAAASWEDLRDLQFANGTLTAALYGVGSVLSLRLADAVVVAPELGAYAAAVGAPVALETAEANAFLRVYANATLSLGLATGLYAASLGDYSVFADPTYVATGLTASNADLYAAYLFSYLPESFFLKGAVVGYERDWTTALADPAGLLPGSLTLRSDGTGRYNSGLFTRRTAREILFGYDDVIFSLVPPELSTRPLAYNGVMGKQYDDIEAQEAAGAPLTYGLKTGKDHLDDVGQYTLWRGITEVEERSDIPNKDGSSYTCATWASQGYESCAVWLDAVTMAGLSTSQVGPFRHQNRKAVEIWSTEVFRPLTLVHDKEVTIHKVKAGKYVFEDDQFYSGDCAYDPCDESNAAYRMAGPAYVAPMATTQGGAPAAVSFPALGKVEARFREDLFDGLPDYSKRSHGSYVAVEPITGVFVEGHKRVQYNWNLDAAIQSAALWANVFAREPAYAWPHLWIDDGDEITADQAKRFVRKVYAPVMVAWAFAIIAGCLGLLALMGACWAYHVDEHLLPTKPYYATTNEEARLDAELASFEPRPSGSSL